jgi:putative oligomerization/nucleic acid binding protein
MPGLIRGVARTAVVAGTATAVSNRVSRRQASRWSSQDAAQYQEPAQYAAPPPPPPAADATDDRLERLKQLTELRDAGALTPAEFEAEKAKILNS